MDLTRCLCDWIVKSPTSEVRCISACLPRDLSGLSTCSNCGARGLEDRRVKLGCVMPGESAAVFGDALRRLATAATYLYQDRARYWFSTSGRTG